MPFAIQPSNHLDVYATERKARAHTEPYVLVSTAAVICNYQTRNDRLVLQQAKGQTPLCPDHGLLLSKKKATKLLIQAEIWMELEGLLNRTANRKRSHTV